MPSSCARRIASGCFSIDDGASQKVCPKSSGFAGPLDGQIGHTHVPSFAPAGSAGSLFPSRTYYAFAALRKPHVPLNGKSR